MLVLDGDYIKDFLHDYYLFAGDDPDRILDAAMEFGFDDELRHFDPSELTHIKLAEHFAMHGVESGEIWCIDTEGAEFDY